MSRVPYPYENDAGLLQGLSNRIRLERVEDLASYVGYVLHDSAWWRVLGSDPAEGWSWRSPDPRTRSTLRPRSYERPHETSSSMRMRGPVSSSWKASC